MSILIQKCCLIIFLSANIIIKNCNRLIEKILQIQIKNIDRKLKIMRRVQKIRDIEQLQRIYEKRQEQNQSRLNSLADTFVSLLNNIENNNLFRELQGSQWIEKIEKWGFQRVKLEISNYRMEYLGSVINKIIQQNQQITIKKLQIENFNLKSQNQYYKKLIEFNQLYQNINPSQHQIHNDQLNLQQSQNLIFNQQQLHKQSLLRFKQKKILGNKLNKFKPNMEKLKHCSSSQLNLILPKCKQSFAQQKISKKYYKDVKLKHQSFQSSLQNSQQYLQLIQYSEPTSFVIGLNQNQAKQPFHNCISSIEPCSQASSIPSSQKRRELIDLKLQSNRQNDNIFGLSLRQQLQGLKRNEKKETKRIEYKKLQERRQKKKRTKCFEVEYDEENEENREWFQYEFKYLKT